MRLVLACLFLSGVAYACDPAEQAQVRTYSQARVVVRERVVSYAAPTVRYQASPPVVLAPAPVTIEEETRTRRGILGRERTTTRRTVRQ